MARISRTDRQQPQPHSQSESDGPHLYANRVRVYPKAVHGPFRRAKWVILALCLGVYYLLPWLRWDRGAGRPNQAVLFDIWHERFYFFGIELWPQDIYYLTGVLIMAAVGLFLVTSLAGRVWCGYGCLQTVWTDLFMWVEERLEGDRNERMRRDAEPVSFDTVWRKAAKHAIWLGIAFWTGGAWIMYYVDAPTVTKEFWVGTASIEVYVFTALFTATTYVLPGWAREQVCTYMCPWPRFQSAMLDEQSFTVTYQAWRGEPRTRGRRDAPAGLEPMSRRGDCVDCGACVTACPTGVDIRDGIQLECINCGLCIDACNHVMRRTSQPLWLITWDTLARQGAKAAGRHEPIRLLRPRTIIYVSALVIAMVAMGVAFAERAMIGLSVQRDRAPLFVRLADGSVRNGYTVRIVNKTAHAADFEMNVTGLASSRVAVAEDTSGPRERVALAVPADDVATFRVLITVPAAMSAGSQPVDFNLRDPVSGETTVYHSTFMGPENGY